MTDQKFRPYRRLPPRNGGNAPLRVDRKLLAQATLLRRVANKYALSNPPLAAIARDSSRQVSAFAVDVAKLDRRIQSWVQKGTTHGTTPSHV